VKRTICQQLKGKAPSAPVGVKADRQESVEVLSDHAGQVQDPLRGAYQAKRADVEQVSVSACLHVKHDFDSSLTSRDPSLK
jgi:hypothetical protein